jgi:hypothetical protein
MGIKIHTSSFPVSSKAINWFWRINYMETAKTVPVIDSAWERLMAEAIDVSGLSPGAVHMVKSLVDTLRSQEVGEKLNPRDPEEWSAALRKWAASHPVREIVIDDSRDTIYGGRGE